MADKALQSKYASFVAYGVANPREESFGEVTTSKNNVNYVYRRMNLRIDMGEGRQSYVQLMGGYDKKDATIRRPAVAVANQPTEFLTIPWDKRFDETMVSQVASYSKISVNLTDTNYDNTKSFLSELDAIEEMEKAFTTVDDQGNPTFKQIPVRVTGDIEYRTYNGETTRNFNLRTIRVMTEKDKQEKYRMELHQTYIIGDKSFSRNFEDELVEKGSTIVAAYVPQYVSKQDGKVVKKVLPLPYAFTVRAKDGAKAVDVINQFVKPNDEDIALEADLIIDSFDGYEKVQGEIEITDDLQSLIDAGFLTEEELKKQMTASGRRIHEDFFKGPMIVNQKVSVNPRYDVSVLDTGIVEAKDIPNAHIDFGDDDKSSDSSDDLDIADIFG